jgi:hypothetical protein
VGSITNLYGALSASTKHELQVKTQHGLQSNKYTFACKDA